MMKIGNDRFALALLGVIAGGLFFFQVPANDHEALALIIGGLLTFLKGDRNNPPA